MKYSYMDGEVVAVTRYAFLDHQCTGGHVKQCKEREILAVHDITLHAQSGNGKRAATSMNTIWRGIFLWD